MSKQTLTNLVKLKIKLPTVHIVGKNTIVYTFLAETSYGYDGRKD